MTRRPATGRTGSGGSPAGILVIDTVDRDRVEVRASGSFTRSNRWVLEERLDLLLACGIRDLRIDFTPTVTVDRAAGRVFRRIADRLDALGGVVHAVNLSEDLAAAMGWAGARAGSAVA